MTNPALNQGNGLDDLLKYFIAHKSLYAINIWRQNLIKLWRTPNAGAAALSFTSNVVRGPSRALWEAGCSEGGWY